MGTSGTITVNGQNFIDQFGNQPSPFINNSGVTLTLGSVSDTQASVNYSVESNASTGDFGLNLKGLFGNGEPATLAVGDPTPVVTGISPSVWYAGNSYTVTITGTNFGTNPTSSISAAPGVTYSQTGGNDTTITASVTVAPNAPNTDPITVTVTSQGFGGGSGFFSGSGQSPTTSTTAQAVAGAPPAPVINLLNGTTASPFAGQLISLSVSPPSSAWTLASQTWIIGSTSDAVVNYIATSACGAPVPVSSAAQTVCGTAVPAFSTTQTTLPNYYYIVPGATETVTVTVTYSLANGSNSSPASATQTFTVQGPTGNTLPNVFVQPNNSGSIIHDLNGPNPNADPATLQMLNAPGHPYVAPNYTTVGIFFNDLATLPVNTGSFVWTQIINFTTYNQIFQDDQGYNPPANKGLGLDGEYPYLGNANSLNPTTSDAPGRLDLHNYLGEVGESFDATMYVLWDPAIPPSGHGNCSAAWVDTSTTPYTAHPSTCASIPVPLASVEWTWSACAINSLAAGPNGNITPAWAVNCGKGGYSQPVASGYPKWSTCNASKFGGCQ